MKKCRYETPEIYITEFSPEDVITASGGSDVGPDEKVEEDFFPFESIWE